MSKHEEQPALKEIPRFYHPEPSAYELSQGRENGYAEKMQSDLKACGLNGTLIRKELSNFPELTEIEVLRHFTNLARRNIGIEDGIYPLGSCTMKYNPKVNEAIAARPDFAEIHPYQPMELVQGAMEVTYRLQQLLCAVVGLDVTSLQPAAGAQAELAGMRMIQAFHQSRSQDRNLVLIPDSAHGTNPASAKLCGMEVVTLPTGPDGYLQAKHVKEQMNERVAALMITNPNTLGIFEEEIVEICKIVHEQGGLVYGDGANLNALLGVVDFKRMGIDVMHINLHKTFSTPHGGGGPGCGALVARDILSEFMPAPIVVRDGDRYAFSSESPNSIGRFKVFNGNFGMILRAYAYILSHGAEGLTRIAHAAVMNANYLREKLVGKYDLPYKNASLHEVVLTDKHQRQVGVSTLDIAKRLMDFGYHPPTIYFPLIVKGAIMIEPTETVSRRELDRFASAMIRIAEEAEQDPKKVTSAPHCVGLGRLDETGAARKPILTWNA